MEERIIKLEEKVSQINKWLFAAIIVAAIFGIAGSWGYVLLLNAKRSLADLDEHILAAQEKVDKIEKISDQQLETFSISANKIIEDIKSDSLFEVQQLLDDDDILKKYIMETLHNEDEIRIKTLVSETIKSSSISVIDENNSSDEQPEVFIGSRSPSNHHGNFDRFGIHFSKKYQNQDNSNIFIGASPYTSIEMIGGKNGSIAVDLKVDGKEDKPEGSLTLYQRGSKIVYVGQHPNVNTESCGSIWLHDLWSTGSARLPATVTSPERCFD